ncbi:spore germination protein [Clostridium estertheticum]|uniref:GerAB/ArcD/ProY family transporter n=1 Tax=Clostridium estertheticum TaxID=238834 RepID=UPI0013E90459|nr:endospore germination permease [Clostridium estertheticum]MBZ9686750.1 spore germination protein [Clostridium estertheticum]
MNEHLTNRQIAFMVFGGIIGYGIMSLPKDIAEVSGTGGWIPLLITTVIVVIAGYMFTYLGYVHKEKTIYDYSVLLTGKFIGNILILIYIIYFFSLFTMVSRASSEVINLSVLIKTPTSVLALIILLISYYAITKKLKGIGRICELYGMIIIFLALIIHTLISTQGNLNNLRPFVPPVGIVAYLKAIPTSIFALLVGVEAIALIPFNKNINDKKVFKYVTFMIIFIGLFYIFIVESCISVLGVDSIIYYNDALLATIRRINIEFLEFLSRLDGFFIAAWIMAIFNSILINAYATVFLLSKWFKKISFNKLAFIVIVIGFFTSLLPKTLEDVQKIIKFTGYLSIFTVLVIPLILVIITKVKKYDKKV